METSDVMVLLVILGLGGVAVYFLTRPSTTVVAPAPAPPCNAGVSIAGVGISASCGAISSTFHALTDPAAIDKIGSKVGSAGKTVADVGVRSSAAFLTGGLSETKTGRKIVGQVENIGDKIVSFF
jgi:hypothetical protein